MTSSEPPFGASSERPGESEPDPLSGSAHDATSGGAVPSAQPSSTPLPAAPMPGAPGAPVGSGGPGSAPVLAHGYLHPGILFLRLAMAVRGTILPVIFALLVADGGVRIGIIVFTVLVVVLNMTYALIRFVTFRYWLTTEELITTEGIFNRQERRIPVNRVQDLSFEQTLVRRMFGLVVVTVETASGEGSEATLDSLGLRPAAQLREAMQYIRSQAPQSAVDGDGEAAAGAGAGAGAGLLLSQQQEEVLFRVRAWDLTLRGLTDNRAGAIIIGLFVLAEQADQLGALKWLGEIVAVLLSSFRGMDTSMQVLVAAGALLLVLLLGWIVSIAASFLLFHGFTLVRRGEIFQRRYGLLTTRVRSLPKRKIQRVLIEQTLLRRLFRLCVMRADSAGSGTNQDKEVKGGLDVVAPLAKLSLGRRLVPHLLPGMFPEGMPWHRVSSKVVTRLFVEGAVLALFGMSVAAPFVGWYALLGLLWPVIALGTGILVFHNLGYSHATGHFAMRWGILGRYRAFIPLHKVQAVCLRAGPWDRMFGMARLVVYVAGAAPTTLQHLTRRDAEQLQRDLATTAAHSKFVW